MLVLKAPQPRRHSVKLGLLPGSGAGTHALRAAEASAIAGSRVGPHGSSVFKVAKRVERDINDVVTGMPAHGTATVTGSPGTHFGIRITYTPDAGYLNANASGGTLLHTDGGSSHADSTLSAAAPNIRP